MVEHREQTRAAYDEIAELYASMFADRLETRPFARAMVGAFAELVRGTGNPRTADVGCGPGHLTAMLHDLGLDAFGLDLSPAMVEHARRANPALRFEEASMEALPIEDGALGGVLAHYSMIHTPPEELLALLAEQARVLAPGGLLLVSSGHRMPRRAVPAAARRRHRGGMGIPIAMLVSVVRAFAFAHPLPRLEPGLFSYPHQVHCLVYLDRITEREGALASCPATRRTSR